MGAYKKIGNQYYYNINTREERETKCNHIIMLHEHMALVSYYIIIIMWCGHQGSDQKERRDIKMGGRSEYNYLMTLRQY